MAEMPQRQQKVIVLSPRDRRRTKLAAAIERVALSLFIERGFSAVTVDEIADAADISKRTFFRYFSSKEDLLLGDRQRYDDSLATAVAKERPGQSAVDMLRNIIVEMSREVEAEADLTRLRLELFRKYPETMSGAFEQQRAWSSTLTAVVAQRMRINDSRDIRPALMVGVMVSAGNAALQTWFARGANQPLHELVEGALDQTIAGLGELDRVRSRVAHLTKK
ncbi:MAG TPA: TetR family transcriptional regulator [Candidatus Binataceae bacterium]|jgi:AcrR family transcriptional regulator